MIDSIAQIVFHTPIAIIFIVALRKGKMAGVFLVALILDGMGIKKYSLTNFLLQYYYRRYSQRIILCVLVIVLLLF